MIVDYTDREVGNQSGRTFLVTGANAGLGFETAKVLAAKGGRVLLGCRSKERAQAAMEKISSEYPEADLKHISLDQADLKSVQKAAKLVQQEKRLDVLINNAGVMGPPYTLTKDGFELQFGVNHLGTFALTGLLLSKLEETKKSRIVVTSSLAHRQGRINFDDINAEKRYNAWQRYGMSKLANMLFFQELNRRLEAKNSPTIATCCHPGIASTELARHLPKPAQIFMPVIGMLLNTPAQGAWPTLAAAVGKGAEGGKYYGPNGLGEWSGKATEAYVAYRGKDEETAERLWGYIGRDDRD